MQDLQPVVVINNALDSTAIISISAAVVALTQLIKWSGLPDKYGPVCVLGLSVVGVAIWGFSKGTFVSQNLFDYFAGWIAVATSAAGVFGFTRASREAITKTDPPPLGAAGGSATTGPVILLACLLGGLSTGCASAAGRLVLTEDAIHDSLAKVDDGVRRFCSPSTPMLEIPCADARSALLPAMRAGNAFNRSLSTGNAASLQELFDALKKLGAVLEKFPASETAEWVMELSRAIASAFNVTFRR